MKFAPIALFVYNRPYHTERTIEALKKNLYASESELFIFSDGPKEDEDFPIIIKVREIINNVTGFKTVRVIEQANNLGLANSIINGVTKICKEYEKVIVLEDDLITSWYFLKFMNEGLDYYESFSNIFTVCGFNFPPHIMKIPKKYSYDVYFTFRNNSTGWGTWNDRWEKADWDIDDFKDFISDRKKIKMFNESGEDLTDMLKAQFEGKIDSWSIRWTYTHFKYNALAVYPVHSFIDNIGFDGSGIHSKNVNKFSNILYKSEDIFHFITPYLDPEILISFRKIYNYKLKTKIKKYLIYNYFHPK